MVKTSKQYSISSEPKYEKIIYAVDHDTQQYRLYDENPLEPLPSPNLTYREYFKKYSGTYIDDWSEEDAKWFKKSTPEEIKEEYGCVFEFEQLDEVCPYELYEEGYNELHWASMDKTHSYLAGLDLGNSLKEKVFMGIVGGPGNSFYEVSLEGNDTLLELEKKLIELGESVKIEKLVW